MTQSRESATSEGAVGALHSVRVIDLAREPIAWAGKLLADMGADVILAEPLGGEASRK
ncbi:MAG: CoA transferase [Gammaproteobacteria bacterium]|nr:CoA transferase [Gammaproteobacteria bacterium]